MEACKEATTLTSVHLDHWPSQSRITLYRKALNLKQRSLRRKDHSNKDKSLKDKEVKMSADTHG